MFVHHPQENSYYVHLYVPCILVEFYYICPTNAQYILTSVSYSTRACFDVYHPQGNSYYVL